MSNVATKSIVDEAIQSIESNLSALNPPATAAEIDAALRGPIEAAFTAARALSTESEAQEAANKALYRALSLKLHPDKLTSSKAPFAQHLKRLSSIEDGSEWLQMPQAILEEAKVSEASVLDAAFNSSDSDSDETEFWERAYSYWEPIYWEPITQKYNDYPLPIRSIIWLMKDVSLTLLGITTVVPLAIVQFAYCFPLLLMSRLNAVLMNMTMSDAFYEAFFEKPVAMANAAKAARLALYVLDIACDEDLTDADVLSMYMEIRVEKEYADWLQTDATARIFGVTPELEASKKAALRADAKNELFQLGILFFMFDDFKYISFVFDVFADLLKKPLAGESFAEKAGSSLYRVMQALLMTMLFLVEGVLRAPLLLVSAISTLVDLAILIVNVSVSLIINTPLYAYDAASSAYQGCKSMFFSQPEVDVEPPILGIGSSVPVSAL